ncbi:MAG TPA: LysR family transcriptional regulator [Oscillospiraceae bacterium]|nr:LysR family transcriptional regulator [Oscillospiraceae bacterium]
MVHNDSEKLSFSTKIKVIFNDSVFGPGVVQIMELVQNTGSLSQAYRTMNLSPSKGWRIIRNTERELGFPLFETTIGGKDGGGARLTKKGEDLLNRYRTFIHQLNMEAEKLYNKYFHNF